jgi:hypothetical protein
LARQIFFQRPAGFVESKKPTPSSEKRAFTSSAHGLSMRPGKNAVLDVCMTYDQFPPCKRRRGEEFKMA